MVDLETVLQRLHENVSASIRSCMPAKIVKYDFKTQKAEIKLDMKELYSNGEQLDYPIVSGVPVVHMISGGASITPPVKVGDFCYIIFADRDISNWLLGGQGLAPDSRRTHNINDAIAVMGLKPFTKTSPAENNEDLLISYDGSKVRFKPNGNLEIVNASTIIIETTNITIICQGAVVNCENDVEVNCNNAKLKAVDTVSVDCVNAIVKAKTKVEVNCENSSVVASNNINIEGKNTYITSTELIHMKCVDLKVSSTGAVDVTCQSANITSTGDITTSAVNFIHTGNTKFNGNIEITGTSLFTGAVTSKTSIDSTGGITNTGGQLTSNGITLETHKHDYIDSIGEPPIPTPSITGIAK